MAGEKNLVSIVLPYYNGKQFIKETIDSIVSQTYAHFELLLVDDGSPYKDQSDYVKHLIDSYRDERLNYYYKKNGGLADARNFCIDNAKGEFIAFIDQDDLWAPDKLKRQVDVFKERPDVNFICTDGEMFGEINRNFNIYKKVRLKKGFVRQSYRRMLKGNFVIASSVIFRRKLISEIGYSNRSFTTAPDYEYFIKFSRKYDFYFIPEPLTRYRIHEHNTVKNIIRLHCETIIILSQQDLSSIPQRYFAMRYFLISLMRCFWHFVTLVLKKSD
jgi:glycosyltransferase involved in cell wall biosynthesis